MGMEKDLDELVRAIVQHAAKKDVPFHEKIDALKALTAYRLSEQKLQKSRPDDTPEDEPSFAMFRNELKNGDDHGAKPARVRGGRERPS